MHIHAQMNCYFILQNILLNSGKFVINSIIGVAAIMQAYSVSSHACIKQTLLVFTLYLFTVNIIRYRYMNLIDYDNIFIMAVTTHY